MILMCLIISFFIAVIIKYINAITGQSLTKRELISKRLKVTIDNDFFINTSTDLTIRSRYAILTSRKLELEKNRRLESEKAKYHKDYTFLYSIAKFKTKLLKIRKYFTKKINTVKCRAMRYLKRIKTIKGDELGESIK